MKITELTEGYNPNHKCKTPDTIYNIEFHKNEISINLKLPKSTKNVEIDNYDDLEADLHYALETVLAKYYFNK